VVVPVKPRSRAGIVKRSPHAAERRGSLALASGSLDHDLAYMPGDLG